MSDIDAPSDLDIGLLKSCEQRGRQLWRDLDTRPNSPIPDKTLPPLENKYTVEAPLGLNPLEDVSDCNPSLFHDNPHLLAFEN
ncbi:hypothetical protein FPOAC2_03827 [Fusarium poae]